MLHRYTVVRHNTGATKEMRLAHSWRSDRTRSRSQFRARWVVLRDMILGSNVVPTAPANSATAFRSVLFYEVENCGTESIRIANWGVMIHVAENNFLGFWHAPLKCFDHYGEVCFSLSPNN